VTDVTIEAEYQIGIAMINPCIVAPGPVALKAGQTLAAEWRGR
jgi:hypothetical protein